MSAELLPQRRYAAYELIVALVAVALVGSAFVERLHWYQEAAEKAAMETTMRLVKTGLQIRLAELIIGNRQAEADQLETEDPMQWLDARPANYGGDYRQAPEPGKWYFDAARRQLVYVVHSGRHLQVGADEGAKELRFQARLLKDRIRTAGGEVEGVTGVSLTPVRPYLWSALANQGILLRLSQAYQRDANDIS